MTINIPILIQQYRKYNGYRRSGYGLKDVRPWWIMLHLIWAVVVGTENNISWIKHNLNKFEAKLSVKRW